jgi:rubrerythrin
MKSLNKTTYLEAVAAAIEHEVKSFNFFLGLSDQLKPGATKELFQQLAADGDEHIVFIKEIYKQAEGKELPNLKTLSEIHKFHSSTIQKLMEKLERNMNQTIETDERKALELAVAHGEDAKKFYSKVKDKFPDPKINILFSRMQDFIDTNTHLIEAQIMAMGQSSQADAQFFWEDEALMKEAAVGTPRKQKDSGKPSKAKPKAKSKEKTKTVKPSTQSKKSKPKSKMKVKSSQTKSAAKPKKQPKKKSVKKTVKKKKK